MKESEKEKTKMSKKEEDESKGRKKENYGKKTKK